MQDLPLAGKRVLITGAARRLGRAFALACARSGADVIIHYGRSAEEARFLEQELTAMGRAAGAFECDLSDPAQAAALVGRAAQGRPLYALVNSASLFEPLSARDTTFEQWDRHLAVNLTAPFLLSQAFARLAADATGRIVNLLDWRALRPGADHLPYTVSKAALAALTQSLAAAFAPNISVNALALGALLPPEGQSAEPGLVQKIPLRRWGEPQEAEQALLFLLAGPAYITGEILHVDGGRHLV